MNPARRRLDVSPGNSAEMAKVAEAHTTPASEPSAGRPHPVPPHPERVCWGCDQRCPSKDLACGNGSVRTPHPVELFGDVTDS